MLLIVLEVCTIQNPCNVKNIPKAINKSLSGWYLFNFSGICVQK